MHEYLKVYVEKQIDYWQEQLERAQTDAEKHKVLLELNPYREAMGLPKIKLESENQQNGR